MKTITTLAIAIALGLGLTGAQTEHDLIDIDYLTVSEFRIVEVEWAGDEPYADVTSTFDGRCSVASHFLAHGEGDMINFPMGRHVFRFIRFCGLLTWGAGADGERVITDMAFPDGEYGIDGPGGAFYTARFASVGTDVDPLTGALLLMLEHIDLTASGIALPGLSFVSGELGGPTIVYDVEAFLEGALPTVTLVQGVVRFAPEAPQTIDLETTSIGVSRMVEIEWAGDEPFSGETSTFDGRCSVPSDFILWNLTEGLAFPTGPFTAECQSCGQLVWEDDEDGQPVVRGHVSTDGVSTLRGADGSVTTMTFVQDETSFDPVMGVFTFGMHFDFQSITGLEGLGLDFLAGSARATYVATDIVALLTESAPKMGVIQGGASFVPVATD